jgi:hypothetical protein
MMHENIKKNPSQQIVKTICRSNIDSDKHVLVGIILKYIYMQNKNMS